MNDILGMGIGWSMITALAILVVVVGIYVKIRK